MLQEGLKSPSFFDLHDFLVLLDFKQLLCDNYLRLQIIYSANDGD